MDLLNVSSDRPSPWMYDTKMVDFPMSWNGKIGFTIRLACLGQGRQEIAVDDVDFRVVTEPEPIIEVPEEDE